MWFVGELFDRRVWCQSEGASAHKVDVGVGVVARPRGVAVEVCAGGADDEDRLFLLFVFANLSLCHYSFLPLPR